MLRLAPQFRPLSESNEMALSPNVIRQLELLQSGEGTHRGSLLWLMGSNTATPAGRALTLAIFSAKPCYLFLFVYPVTSQVTPPGCSSRSFLSLFLKVLKFS